MNPKQRHGYVWFSHKILQAGFDDKNMNLDQWEIKIKNNKWFHVKPDGSTAYKQRYDEVWPFSESLAAVKLDGKWFHIKPNGSPAYKQRFDEVYSFHKGSARVQINNEYFYIKPNGSRVN